MTSRSHLDPSVRIYVNDSSLAYDYDHYFARNPLFPCDEEFVLDYTAPGSRVLDLGVGTGRHLLRLARRECRVTGVDLSTHMLKVLQQKLKQANLNASLIQADICNLPLSPELRFDAILLMFSTLGLIHGAARREQLLAEVANLLADNGILILHVHNNNYRYSPHRGFIKPIQEKLSVISGRLEPGDHIVRNYRGVVDLRLHSFTIAEIQELFHKTGLKIVELAGLNDRRDGMSNSYNFDRDANGFLIVAAKDYEKAC
ncbi:MAG: class I SAM-dependent methyltransferase [Planctomycetes bacterium]|nr:class I SAM-dependent methyltransferase [Planctomycetota bacterium]